MTLTREYMDKKMDEHFAFEAADNIEGVLSTLAPNVEHDIVGWPAGPTCGREQARPFYTALFGDLADGKVQTIRRLYGESFLVDESLWRGQAPGKPFGIDGNGRPLEFRLLHVVRFTNGGEIEGEQVWIDLAAIQQQLSATSQQAVA
jgi:hypothetical protein